LRVDVRNPEDISRFCKQLLTDPHFFAGREQAIAPNLAPETLAAAAKDFHDRLSAVIPKLAPAAAQATMARR
jgi:hypothetical protein